MRVEDREPGEKPRRSNPNDDTPAPTGDNPTNPPGGGDGNGGNGGGGNRGGGNHGGGGHGGDNHGGDHHGGDNNPDHHRNHRHDHRDGDDDRHRHHRRHDDNTIYQNDNQNANKGGASSINECDRGYDDGLYTGANDARRGQSYDPQRSHFHKRGGGGIFSIGRGDAAKQEYRECFLRGYEEGFRNYQNYFSNGSFHP